MTLIQNQFRAEMLKNGINTDAQIIPNGELQRFHVTGDSPHSLNGWAVLYGDGISSGAYGCWKRGISKTWCSKSKDSMTPEEWQQHIVRIETAKEKYAKSKTEAHAKARENAQQIWNKAEQASNDHPYLVKKKVKAHCIRVGKDGRLVTPIHDNNNNLHSLQFISIDNSKMFLKDGAISGHYFFIGNPTDTICLCEGYATGASIHEATNYGVAVAFNAGNLLNVAQEIKNKYSDSKILICADNDSFAEGNPGLTKGREAAKAIGAAFVYPDFSKLDVSNRRPTDFNDLLVLLMAKGLTRDDALGEVRRQLTQPNSGNYCMTETSEDQNSINNLMNEIPKLAEMNKISYELVRKEISEKYGIRAAILDQLVNDERKRMEDQNTDNELFPVTSPWNEEVRVGVLLNEISNLLNQFVVFQSEHESRAISLWILHTHLFMLFDRTPFLFISSPEKRCGKSTLFELIQQLVSNPLIASNISSAALFRAIELYAPTLMIEEVDSFLRENEEFRGIVNASNSRSSSFVLRCEGDPPEPKRFNTFCPKAFCGIGKLPETIEDRAIIVKLSRKTSDEKKEKRRLGNKNQQNMLNELRSKCVRFAQDNTNKLENLDYVKEVEPYIPVSLDSRAMDNWEPLFALARLAGDEWVKYAQDAALHLSGVKETSPSIGVELLSDIQDIFDALKSERIFSKTLLEKLNQIDDAPWSTFYHGKHMTARQLSSRLGDFKVKSKDIRIGEEKAKGFERSQFEDAWKRYIPSRHDDLANPPKISETSETARQVNNDGASGVSHISLSRIKNRDKGGCLGNVSVPQARQMQNVSDKKSSQPNNDGACLVVSDKPPILEGVTGATNECEYKDNDRILI